MTEENGDRDRAGADGDETRTGNDTQTDDDTLTARRAARRAAAYMDEMTGTPPEVVSGVEPDDDGWLVTVEMLELSRIPDTTDVLGCYQVRVDQSGEPSAYRRVRRYHRGHVGEDA